MTTLLLPVTSDVAASPSPVGFGSLPQELLDHIVSYLDGASPVLSRLHDQPTFAITSSSVKDLKNTSAVCRSLRRSATPRLYKHSRILVDGTLTSLEDFSEDYEDFLEFIEKHKLQSNVQSFVLCFKYQDVKNLPSTIEHNLAGIWRKFFERLNVHELTIVAEPEILGALTGCLTKSPDSWLFEMDYHILRLCVNDNPQSSGEQNKAGPSSVVQTAEPTDSSPPASPSASAQDLGKMIFKAKAWTSLLLNEGSFIKGFHTYEYFHKSPSSILPSLLGHPLGREHDHGVFYYDTLIPQSLRDFSYVAMFPTQTHFHLVTSRLPRVDRFFVQLTPTNDIVKNKELMATIDIKDLWMERNHCYTMIMRELFDVPPGGNFKHIEIFESGDAADEDAWEMAVNFVERQGGWKVERPGVFVRNMKGNKSAAGDDPSFTGALLVPNDTNAENND